MAHDVFISYSSRDKAVADAICATLESRRIRCWIAPRDVLPGVAYGGALIDAITASRVLVLVFSSNSNRSPQVMREVERAVSKGIPILPFRIEAVAPSKDMEYFISAQHWLDAVTPPLQGHLDYLADTVHLLLSRSGTAADSARGSGGLPSEEDTGRAQDDPAGTRPEERVAKGQRTVRRRRVPISAMALAVLFLALFLAANRFPFGRRFSPPAHVDYAGIESLRTLPAPGQKALAFSRDSRTLAVSQLRGSVGVWDSETGVLLRSLDKRASRVISLGFSPDGRTLACGSDEGLLTLWDPTSGALKWTQEPSSPKAWVRVAFSPDGKTVATGDGWPGRTVKLRDARTGERKKTLDGGSGYIYSVAFSSDGEMLASACGACCTVQLWDPRTGAGPRSLQRQSHPMEMVAFASGSRILASATGPNPPDDNTVQLWDARTGRLLQTLQKRERRVHSLAFSPDGRTLAFGGEDSTIEFWDVQVDSGRATFRHRLENGGWVNALAFSPDGKRLASGSGDEVRVWRVSGR